MNEETAVAKHNDDILDHLQRVIEAGNTIKQDLMNISREQMPPRRFKGEERETLLGVSNSAFYHAESDGRIPMEDRDERNRRMGSTLAEILQLQEIFGKRPGKADNEDAVTISVTNFKGGCTKSTTCFYAGSYFANQGFKVLLVDLDPQATLTLNCGLLPDIQIQREHSMASLIVPESGLLPPPSLRDIIRPTHLPSMDIVPSTLALSDVEMLLSAEMMHASMRGDTEAAAGLFTRVRDLLSEVRSDYDLILLDGTPSLGILPLNIVFGSDLVLVPVPTEITDFSSTITFCELYATQAVTIIEKIGNRIVLPEMVYIPTRFSPSEHQATYGSAQVLQFIRDVFGDRGTHSVIRRHDAVISNLSLVRRTVFDINSGDAGVRSETRKRAMENFGAVFDEVYRNHIIKRWPSKLA